MEGFDFMRTRKHLGIFATIVAVLGLVLVACGNDDSDNSADAQGVDAETNVEAEATDDSSSRETTENAARNGGTAEPMDISSLSTSDCLDLGRSAFPGVYARGMVSDFEGKLATLRSFAAAAPAETEAEITVFLDAYEASYNVIIDAGIDPSDPQSFVNDGSNEVMNEAEALVETPEVEAAGEAAEAFLYEVCPMLNE